MIQADGIVNPAFSFSDYDGLVEIHGDNPQAVKRAFQGQGRFGFQAVDPAMSESSAAMFEQITTMSRSESYMAYSGTENTKVSMSLSFCASVVENEASNSAPDPYDFALRAQRWFKALCYPTYDQGLAYPPPLLRLVHGRMYALRCILTGLESTPEGALVGQTFKNYPLVYRLSLEFTAVHTRAQDTRDILPSVRGGVSALL